MIKHEIENYDDFKEYLNESSNYYIDDEFEYEDQLLIGNFKKIYEDKLYNNNIELFIDLFEIDDYYYINTFNDYEFEIDNINFILINHSYKLIKNLTHDDLYDLIKNYIIESLDLNNKVYYDKIIKVFNIINKYNTKCYTIDPINNIYYDIFDDDIESFNEFLNNNNDHIKKYDNTIEFIYVNNITSSNKLYIEIIKYEDINIIFYDNIIDDLINYLSSIYYYFYNELNDLYNILGS